MGGDIDRDAVIAEDGNESAGELGIVMVGVVIDEVGDGGFIAAADGADRPFAVRA